MVPWARGPLIGSPQGLTLVGFRVGTWGWEVKVSGGPFRFNGGYLGFGDNTIVCLARTL